VVARFEQHGTKRLISIPITFSDLLCVIKHNKHGGSTILDLSFFAFYAPVQIFNIKRKALVNSSIYVIMKLF